MHSQNLKEILGLKDDMSTYFAHAPAEYFELLGHKTYTYRPDEDGMYQFIHAFFNSSEELEAGSLILSSKLSDDGIMWVSYPDSLESQKLNANLVKHSFESSSLKALGETESIPGWHSIKFGF